MTNTTHCSIEPCRHRVEPDERAVVRRRKHRSRRRRPVASTVACTAAAAAAVSALVLCPSSSRAFSPAGRYTQTSLRTLAPSQFSRPSSSSSSATALYVSHSSSTEELTSADPKKIVADLTKKVILPPAANAATATDENYATDAAEHHDNHWITHDEHVISNEGTNGHHAGQPMDDDVIVPEATALVLSDEEQSAVDVAEPQQHTHLPPSERKIWEGATWREKRGLRASHIPEKLFNAALLALSFGFALYTILNIDSEITRGWTQGEIAMRIPLDTWSSYEASLSSKPIETKTLINVVIYLLGDWLSQTVFQKKDVLDFDAARTLRNGFIGLCFGPLVHEYYEFSDSILPVDVGINRIYKILMDQTIYLFVKCSVYIVAVGTLSGQGFKESADNAKERIGPIMFTAWKFWPLVHCVTYSVIPAQHRILWVNSVDLVWNAILATKASGNEEEEEADAVDVDGGEGIPELMEGENDLVAELGELDGVQVMEGTVAAVAAASIESTSVEGLELIVEEKPRLTLLEQYRKLEV